LQDDEDEEEGEGEEEEGAAGAVRTGGMDVDAGEEAADDGIPVQVGCEKGTVVWCVAFGSGTACRVPTGCQGLLYGALAWLPGCLPANPPEVPACVAFLLSPCASSALSLPPRLLQEIDAYWLQRRISKAFGDIDPNAAQKLAEDTFEALQVGGQRCAGQSMR